MTHTPQLSIQGLTFYPIPEVSDIEVVLGAKGTRFFNRWELPDVPPEYEAYANKVFLAGGRLPELQPAVDRAKARRAMQAWLCSFAPPHEAKIATVAYALWVWTEGDLS